MIAPFRGCCRWSWLCSLGLLLCFGCSQAVIPSKPESPIPWTERVTEKGPVKLTIRVAPAEPRLSDLVEMEILVVGREHIAIEPPAFGQAVGDFLVLDYSERTKEMSGNAIEPNSRLFHYQLEPLASGQHLIRSIGIEFTDNRPESESSGQKSRIESEPVTVNVISELGDSIPDLAQLEPMVAPKPIQNYWGWLWLIPVVILIAFFMLLLWVTRSKNGGTVLEPIRDPNEVANEQLTQLLAEELPAKGLFKEFYLRLTGIVRQYIECTTGLRAPEQTTDEFLRAANANSYFSKEQATGLQDFLEAADMVKYAGQQPDSDQITLATTRAREFIRIRFNLPAVHPLADANDRLLAQDSSELSRPGAT